MNDKNYHCQICSDKVNLMSNNLVISHGYKVVDGIRVGECEGSDFLPIEKSTAILKHTVIGLKKLESELKIKLERYGAIKELRESLREAQSKLNSLKFRFQKESFKKFIENDTNLSKIIGIE